MSGTFSQTILKGRFTKDPELRFTPSGAGVVEFTVVTDSWVSGRDGSEGKEVPEFHSCFAWNHGNRKLAEVCGPIRQEGGDGTCGRQE